MSCGSGRGTMPINIENTNNKCDKTCNYEFNYANSDLTVTNKGDYLKLSYNANSSSITYNNTQYTVKDIRIYKPSLNKYNGIEKDAEIFIHHISNNGLNLLVCVPIEESNKMSVSNNLLKSILRFSPENNNEKATINVNNYTLNNIIPRGSFYSYNGSLPYDSCNGNYDIILFDPKYSANIDKSMMDNLGKLITPTKNTIKNVDSNKIQYNVEGTKVHLDSNNEDDIYIDCKPVDELGNDDSETQYEIQENNRNKSTGLKLSKDQEKMLYTGGGIIGGFVLMYILYKLGKKILDSTEE
jgi:carbonic anhydrase